MFFLITYISIFGQEVPIDGFSLNTYGQAQIEIQGESDKYYLLSTKHGPELTYETITSMTIGTDGPMIISESLASFGEANYTVTAHSIANPDDTDGDGVDDITEFNDMPTYGPINFARVIPFNDGSASIPTREVFADLAVVSEDIPWAPFLNDQEFVKFAIVNQSSDEPEVYFINSKTHAIHADFLNTINVDQFGDDVTTGEVVYNPNFIMPNGAIGRYTFNYSFGDATSFEETRETFELLAVNMPFLQNNLQHFISTNSEGTFNNLHKDNYIGSRITVVLESEVFAEVDYLPFNQAEGYGFFKHMDLDETPGSRDVVLYDALPNSLPRVGGIITSVIQTPLSHVNLRAIQDNVPNAFIRDPLAIDSIANLLGKYIYYTVDQEKYFIREASIEEVNEWYEKLRPTESQIPERDLSFTEILPLDDIGFEMSTAFGAKCTNVATMRTFGFPEGTIPDGFGVPFYFYDEFMKFNGFYDEANDILTDPDFLSDLDTRIEMLDDFRKKIRKADMPQWMLDQLQTMHDAFPDGTSVRCRSSTNNEDLPGFSGAGLYTSKTQHPDEGHISKSIKQVYASMWNFRAYDERDFYRVDHSIAAMGVLCHPNFQDEKSNGVGVSLDPIYNTDSTFYINTQVGEALITNPEANEIPEEILLHQNPDQGYNVLRNSNLVPIGELVMSDAYLNELREYLQVIHDEFAILYNVVGAEGFGMDIEYKVTKENQLSIKQARPWVSFWADIKANKDLSVTEITEPITSATLSDSEFITGVVANRGLEELRNFDLSLIMNDQVVETLEITDLLGPQTDANYQFTIPIDLSTIGEYEVSVLVSHPDDGYSKNDTLNQTIKKLHALEGAIEINKIIVKCGQEIDIRADIYNLGADDLTSATIEVIVNGTMVETVNRPLSLVYDERFTVSISTDENLQQTDNIIELNLLSLNGQQDAISDNNKTTAQTDLESDFDDITIIINADDYPQETSWILSNYATNEIVATGELDFNQEIFEESYCIDYSSCYSLILNDSANDGICCSFGQGDFLVLDADGNTIFTNDGEFSSSVEEIFCVNGQGCSLQVSVEATPVSTEGSGDGMLTISTSGGIAPYSYSIDGGNTFSEEISYSDLPQGDYMIVVQDATAGCTYEETVAIGLLSNTDEILTNAIKLYPNPTRDIFTLQLSESIAVTGNIEVTLYNPLGQLLFTNLLTTNGGQSSLELSLANYPSGSYTLKCVAHDMEAIFRVAKL